jgi:soluble lytic murein transglycosylase-like protein
MSERSILQALALTAWLACGAAKPAFAEIYWFTDSDGVMHFSNVPTDRRYIPFSGSDRATDGKASPKRSARRPGLPARARYEATIKAVADVYALESALIHAIVSAESAYNASAVSRKGAAGLMQLMPETAQRYGVADRLDPVQNLHGGARYLRDLLKMFDGNLSLALAGYNAGENSVVRHGYQIPPYAETRTYVPKVLELYRQYRENTGIAQTKRQS